jgi:hypothetical protein
MLWKDKNALALTYWFPDNTANKRKQKIQDMRHKQRYSTEKSYIWENILHSGINSLWVWIYLERIIQEYFLAKKKAILWTYKQDTRNAVDMILKNESIKIWVDITSSTSYDWLNINLLEKKKTKILALTQNLDNNEEEKIVPTSISRKIDSHSILIMYISPWMRNEIIASFNDWIMYNMQWYWSDYVKNGNPKWYIENILAIFETYFEQIINWTLPSKQETNEYGITFQNNIFKIFIKWNIVFEYHYFPTQKVEDKLRSLEKNKK